ncbi:MULTISPECIES: hypothetical protein [Pseudomonas]|uniref:hypothetical protein n=1 Tax=Pseudomonas TaxID=286 RepID=UPI0025D13A49|nr:MULTISPECIES: hypothetical protein [Pseudomonas]MBW8353968.1 hypothetical protein [Pseudomonas sp.]MDP9514659.1 hypothetical protein [Pseudomonas protegens]
MDEAEVRKKCERLLQTDHMDHEDILWSLQQAANPYSIPFLRQAILLKPDLEYLDFDDYGSYYKKCLWALQVIGTPDAFAVIEECTHSVEDDLFEQAIYRMSRIGIKARCSVGLAMWSPENDVDNRDGSG